MAWKSLFTLFYEAQKAADVYSFHVIVANSSRSGEMCALNLKIEFRRRKMLKGKKIMQKGHFCDVR